MIGDPKLAHRKRAHRQHRLVAKTCPFSDTRTSSATIVNNSETFLTSFHLSSSSAQRHDCSLSSNATLGSYCSRKTTPAVKIGFPASTKDREVPDNGREIDLPMAQQFPDKTPWLKTQLTPTSPYALAFEVRQHGHQEHILPLPGPKKPLPCASRRSTRPAVVPTFITSTNRDPTKFQRRNSSRSPSISDSSHSRASDQDSYSGSTSDIEQASPKHDVRVPGVHTLTESQCGPCRNCGAMHEPVKNMWYRDCLIISIRIKRRLHGFGKGIGPSVLTLPPSREKRAAIGTQIWEAFERTKQANEEAREVVKQGKKRDVAPIPWLKFTGKNGRSGQTRNEHNFRSWWMDNVVNGDGNQLPLTHLTVLFDWKDMEAFRSIKTRQNGQDERHISQVSQDSHCLSRC